MLRLCGVSLLGMLGASAVAEDGAVPIVEWVADCRLEPSAAAGLGFVSSRLGTAELVPGAPPCLRTADAEPAADGRYYYRPLASGERADLATGLRLEVTVRVRRAAGHACATAIQVPVGPLEEATGPLTYGEHHEGYQRVLFRERRAGIGFATDPAGGEGEVLLLDVGAAGGTVLARRRVRLDVLRQYTLEVAPTPAGARLDLTLGDEPGPALSAPVSALTPCEVGRDFGLLFGHPAGGGLGEAEWTRVALVTGRPVPVAAPPPVVIAIGHRRQLFLDDHVVAALDGLSREPGTPAKHPANPVLRREHPWEAARCELYGSAVWDPERRQVRLFYSAMSAPYDIRLACAESADGIHWRKPSLTLFPDAAGAPTNIVWPGRYSVHGPSVWRDADDPDPARRYKLLTGDLPVPVTLESAAKGPLGVDVATSADGYRWAPSPRNPVLPRFNSDTAQCLFRDPGSGRYVAYVRLRDGSGQRSVGRTDSVDFETWCEPRLAYAPTAEDRARDWQFYSLSVTPYEGLYVGLVWVFAATPASADPRADTPVCWPELVASRDGWHWQRVAFGQPFLPLGPAGSFDHRQIRTASSLVTLEDRVLLLYAGSPDPHVAAHHFDIGLATLRLDGFVALRAAEAAGTVLTQPLAWDGPGALRVNVEVQSGGHLRATVLDAAGRPLPGYEASQCRTVTGDHLDAELAWAGRTLLPATPQAGLRLRFELQRARLYSFRVAAAP